MKLHLIGSALALAVVLGHAEQAGPAAPQFAVASIRAHVEIAGESRPRANCSAGGRFVSAGVPLKFLIEWAYDVRNEFSVPEWADISGEKYDIEAKAEGEVSQAECRVMTQHLLEERFQLKLHRESKEMPIYTLSTGKNGSKLHEVQADASASDGVWLHGRKVSSKGWEPWMIAATLATMPDVGRPVVDKTGLKGFFEFRLDYASVPGEDRPNLFTAVQEQLGLKLEASKGRVEIVVIDGLQRPSAN